jgi:hypothetical protein
MENISQILFQIALIVVPAGAVLMTAIYFLRRESEKEVRSVQLELKKVFLAKSS